MIVLCKAMTSEARVRTLTQNPTKTHHFQAGKEPVGGGGGLSQVPLESQFSAYGKFHTSNSYIV